jgi:hypothetical protein
LKRLHNAKRVAAFDTFVTCGAVLGGVSNKPANRREDNQIVTRIDRFK